MTMTPEQLPTMRESSSPVRPATDAILIAVRVHQRVESTALRADTPGGTGEFATLKAPARELPPELRSPPPADASCARTCVGRSSVEPTCRRSIATSLLRCRSLHPYRSIQVRGFSRGSKLTRHDAP
jgi:hypothetical protein